MTRVATGDPPNLPSVYRECAFLDAAGSLSKKARAAGRDAARYSTVIAHGSPVEIGGVVFRRVTDSLRRPTVSQEVENGRILGMQLGTVRELDYPSTSSE